MSAILLKTSPSGEQKLFHCAWCINRKGVERFLAAFPVLNGFPVTSGICRECVKAIDLEADKQRIKNLHAQVFPKR